MNFVQQLMRAPIIEPAEERAYNPRKTKPMYRGSNQRYRLYLEGQHRSITEIAERMGYSYGGCYASMMRMLKRGDIKKVKQAGSNGNKGRSSALYTWVVR